MFDKIEDAWLTFEGKRLADNFLKASQFYSNEMMHDYQVGCLKNVLQSAAQHLPYYKKLFWEHDFDVDRFNSLEQLKQLPTLKKSEAFARIDEFYSYELMKKALPMHTSGTTGQPFKVYTSKKQWVVEQGIIWRHWNWADYRFRDKIAIVRSYSPKPGEPIYKLDRLKNWMYFSPYHLSEENVLKYLKVMQEWKPKFLRGYPSSLFILAQVAKQNRITLPSVTAALTASESLLPQHREAIRDAFNIEVFDHYGQAEITGMMHECEQHKGMHVDSEYGYVEFLPTEEENVFRIVATNLHNTVMPLVRYETGDLAIIDGSRCSCQRNLPFVKSIRGRQDDFLLHHEGYRIPSINFYTFFADQSEIYRFQIIQWQADKVECRLQLKPDADSGKTTQFVREQLQHRFGMPVEVKTSEEFETSGGGKCLPIVQKTVQKVRPQ